MFQTFETMASPAQGPQRLAALRAVLAAEGLAGFIVPRADAHQGEYVAPRDERLQWLTGFTGSAGFCVVLPDAAGVFIDGRYRTQVKGQVDLSVFTPVPWPEMQPGPWILQYLAAGVIGYDPWLHTADEIGQLEKSLEGRSVTLRSVNNLVDAVWPDQPTPPVGLAFAHPDAVAGEASLSKRARLAEDLRQAGQDAAVLTLPDSICWLLNLRGSDVPKNPVLQSFAILEADGDVILFVDPAKIPREVEAHLDEGVSLLPVSDFLPALRGMQGRIRVDRTSAPILLAQELGDRLVWGDDPCRLPKARKNPAEIEGMRVAHLRDGAAMVEFLAWLEERTAQGPADRD